MKQHLLLFLTTLLLASCSHNIEGVDFREEMRNFVVKISRTARQQNPGFIVIPQNGIELITTGDDASAALATDYLNAIDGHGQEDLFYGYIRENVQTPSEESRYWLSYLRRSQSYGKTILAIDYCFDNECINETHSRCNAEGFLSFAATHRSLDVIPTYSVPHENSDDILHLRDAQNFLYLINPENYATKQDFIRAVCATNYDLLIMDLFFDDEAFTADEVNQLRSKANGSKRLVICYMSIGEAEDYRYYWDPSWQKHKHKPEWLDRVNPDWAGNYKVRYWYPEWQNIICGTDDSYLNRILNAHFDGVYLDIIDAFEYYEK